MRGEFPTPRVANSARRPRSGRGDSPACISAIPARNRFGHALPLSTRLLQQIAHGRPYCRIFLRTIPTFFLAGRRESSRFSALPAPRFAPGTHRTSERPSSFATLAATKNQSERRFRYLTASGLTSSAIASSVTERSARRATVRQRCRCADNDEPPGRTKLRKGSSASFIASISRSSRETWDSATRSGGRSALASSPFPPGRQRSAPRSNKSFWIAESRSSVAPSACVLARPTVAFSSSTTP